MKASRNLNVVYFLISYFTEKDMPNRNLQYKANVSSFSQIVSGEVKPEDTRKSQFPLSLSLSLSLSLTDECM